MYSRYIFVIPVWTILLFFGFTACQKTENPPMPGFDRENSDARAIEIADRVMEAMGGREAWDQTRYITWNFFGRRRHLWDKWSGDVRIEAGNRLILMNINTKKGRVWIDGEEVTHPDSLAKYLDYGYRAWVNDSYWMFMPYKLKDTGVTLKYLGEGTMQNGRKADILQLTFSNVGVTPQNKYHVYVDQKTGLVGEWAYFPEASDDSAAFHTPWNHWQRYGRILLSDDRGQRKHADIAVFSELPDSLFSSPAPVDWQRLLSQARDSK